MTDHEIIFQYWGKADKDNNYLDKPKWHPLAYHCLDVAAVAASWWDESPAIQHNFLAAFNCTQSRQLRAWVLFFIALHDLGKFDVRFQLKAPNAVAAAWRPLSKDDHGLSISDIDGFDHGWAGMAWANQEYRSWLNHADTDHTVWERWKPWLAAVTGHHGDFYNPTKICDPEADPSIIQHDKTARYAFVSALAEIFLKPEGIGFQKLPPPASEGAQSLLAGFCAICDWIGSNTNVFKYQKTGVALCEYLNTRIAEIKVGNLLRCFGLLAPVNEYQNINTLLKPDESPRGVQVEIDNLPTTPGLTLIEAPTGCGKTEAALAYAWRLLDEGIADSIVFALPTQATANAMLARAETFAGLVFGDANVVLAHGKSQFNEAFRRLVNNRQQQTVQGKEEATIQCTHWLYNSRKRVFLGQVGVCTIDQVLLSVLPVRHKFVRGFGLNKSVLIVDEVHAYDAYMYGLLSEVLHRQKTTGGSAILLSATLPANVRAKLFEAWKSESNSRIDAPYPALWHATQDKVTCHTVPDNQRPIRREVTTECLKLPSAFPDEAVQKRIIEAAESGALVAVVMNLVDDAQRLARLLRNKTTIAVDIFHSRFRFMDRQQKEKAVLNYYGRNALRDKGRILIATQVVEQSLDLDFDWMLTQICPVDLLFQRIGRLHRHQRNHRPKGFELPQCTVFTVKDDNYGLHKHIYGNTRVLWRTERLLADTDKIVFPEAYRDWIERVYQRDDWADEPEAISLDYDAFSALQHGREADACRLTSMTISAFRDEDKNATTLTRDGEMNLTVLPILPDGYLLDGKSLSELEKERDFEEILNLHSVPAPASWEKLLTDYDYYNDGRILLKMTADEQGGWLTQDKKFRYSIDFGLERRKDESA